MAKNKKGCPIYTIVAFASPRMQSAFKKLKNTFNLPSNVSLGNEHYILKDTAHFAIKKTFTLKKGVSEKKLIAQLSKMKVSHILKINCSKSGIFVDTPYGNVLYVGVDKNPNLLKLHDIIKVQIDNIVNTKNLEMEGKNYIPHITVVYNAPNNSSEKVKDYLDKNVLPISFLVKHIFLLKEVDLTKDERKVVYVKPLG